MPGIGRTPAPPSIADADDVLLVGHSAGAYYAQALAHRITSRVAGLALVCPLLPSTHDVPAHVPVIADNALGDAEFRDYFVVQTPAMLARYEQFVAPAAALVDAAAMERIGQRWELTTPAGETCAGPVLLVAGRQDATVGWAATVELLEVYPGATLAVLDGAGHALPHEQPGVLAALVQDWLRRVATARSGDPPGR
nr:alpha/beta hydrolase [Tersicoccus sp. Bi-70]